MNFLEEPAKFFECLKEALSYFDALESDLEYDEASQCDLGSMEWKLILNSIDKRLEGYILEIKKSSLNLNLLDSESKANIDLILSFCEKYFAHTEGRYQVNFVESLAKILKFDDWQLILRVLNIMKLYSGRIKSRSREPPAYLTKDNEEWLLNIALGNNLKNNKKISFLDTLKEKNPVIQFQYFSSRQKNEIKREESCIAREEAPAIRTINLENLNGNLVDSHVIALDLAKKSELPIELFSALWCKIRLAKSLLNDETRQFIVLASLYSYYILRIFL